MDVENLTEKHRELVIAAQETVFDFDVYGPVLQTDDNDEYGPTTAIEKLRESLQD